MKSLKMCTLAAASLFLATAALAQAPAGAPAGLSPQDLAGRLATMLPQAIDKLTPKT